MGADGFQPVASLNLSGKAGHMQSTAPLRASLPVIASHQNMSKTRYRLPSPLAGEGLGERGRYRQPVNWILQMVRFTAFTITLHQARKYGDGEARTAPFTVVWKGKTA